MWAFVLALATLSALAGPAYAKREVTFNYPYSRVWTAAVRLMRVDFEANITEKDRDDGYFLFDYPERGKTVSGSMELVAVKQGETEAVRVVLQIPALPTYVETMIMERLGKKLEQEFGAPKEAKRPDSAPSKDESDGSGDGDKTKPSAPKAKPSDKPQRGNND